MRENAVTVTILRDASSAFESGFSFFRDWPYPAWFANISKPEVLQEFLSNPDLHYNSSTPWYFRAKNYMAFDLGEFEQKLCVQWLVMKEVRKLFAIPLQHI